MSEYWAVKLKGEHWVADDGRVVARHFRGKHTRRQALRHAADWEAESKLVHVTRKPKAPPPLAVGDIVTVRAEVVAVEESKLRISIRDYWGLSEIPMHAESVQKVSK